MYVCISEKIHFARKLSLTQYPSRSFISAKKNGNTLAQYCSINHNNELQFCFNNFTVSEDAASISFPYPFVLQERTDLQYELDYLRNASVFLLCILILISVKLLATFK